MEDREWGQLTYEKLFRKKPGQVADKNNANKQTWLKKMVLNQETSKPHSKPISGYYRGKKKQKKNRKWQVLARMWGTWDPCELLVGK